MTQDEIIRMALELAARHGSRMCDENGETYGEELYCVGIEDVAEIIKQVAAHEREVCAKVCEKAAIQMNYSEAPYKQCAAAIRARGE